MTTLAEILGQERAIGRLQQTIASGRVPHALLFTGPRGAGKHTTAVALAMALNCEDAEGRGCGACGICSRIAAGIHPDIRTLERKGAAQIINIDTVRAEVVAAVGLPPHEAKVRIFLIEEATDLQGPAANALLKTLEEPPARTHFVLCTLAPDKLLPTIRSRCQKLAFAALPLALRASFAAADDPTMDIESATRHDLLSNVILATLDGAPSLRGMFDAAATVSAERADVSATLRLVSEKLHLRARDAVERSELGEAALCARRASLVLDTELAVTMHNAHGQLALEALLSQLRAVS